MVDAWTTTDFSFANAMKIITVATLKGGNAKTTTSLAIAACLAEKGHAVAFLDADPQSTATMILGLRPVAGALGLQLRMIEDAYAFLDASAARFLNEYFADPEHNPRVLGREMTRVVEINSVLPIPKSDSWTVRWTETERSRTGSLAQRSSWEAYLTVEQVVPETEGAIRANPLGLYVTGINWTRIDTSDSEPQT